MNKEEVQRLLDKAGLTSHELAVIRARFQLPVPEGVKPLDLNDPAITRARIRQVEAKALRKIANASSPMPVTVRLTRIAPEITT